MSRSMNSPWTLVNAEVINLEFLPMKCSKGEVIFVFVLNYYQNALVNYSKLMWMNKIKTHMDVNVL